MQLQIFDFIEQVTGEVEKLMPQLEKLAREADRFFRREMMESEDYLNVTTRIKTVESLREKIIRNGYYKHYNSPKALIAELSDLVGVRIECRFVEDEGKLYRLLKNRFSVEDENGFFHTPENDKILLKMSLKQPQSQRNGFPIYRIDGMYRTGSRAIRFELQIKAMVNMFWGEIEHKIIYKNNAYMLADGFLKDIMLTIKNILTVLDNQLLLIYKQFYQRNRRRNKPDFSQTSAMISKMIYEAFADKMRDSLGFVVDFRQSCDLLTEYFYTASPLNGGKDSQDRVIAILNRLREISENNVKFDYEIIFEREPQFDDAFSCIVGKAISDLKNTDYQLNLFLRILFEIERGNNAEDFESFIGFLSRRFRQDKGFERLHKMYDAEVAKTIVEDILCETARCFVKIQSVDFLHKGAMSTLYDNTSRGIIRLICLGIRSREDWTQDGEIYLELLSMRLLYTFSMDIDTEQVRRCVMRIQTQMHRPKMAIHLLDYISENIYPLDEKERQGSV